jgi:hypothetical protein
MGQAPTARAEALWTFVHALTDDERVSLLAHCVSLTVNAIRAPGHRADESKAHAAILAREVGLDIVAYWQPTASSYLPSSKSRSGITSAQDWLSQAARPSHPSLNWSPGRPDGRDFCPYYSLSTRVGRGRRAQRGG